MHLNALMNLLIAFFSFASFSGCKTNESVASQIASLEPTAPRWPVKLRPASPDKELIVSVDVESKCVLSGELDLKNRLLRFNVFPSSGHTEILVGSVPRDVDAEVSLFMPPHCTYKDVFVKSQEITSTPELKHAPCIVVRDDQFANRSTDLPRRLIPTRSESIEGENVKLNLLSYTMIFTDEDSKKTTTQEEEQMTRYGRATDIEVVTRVRLLDDGTKAPGDSTFYQGGFSLQSDCEGFKDFGHSCKIFRGDFVPHTQHPIVFNAAENNIFSDTASKIQEKSKKDMYCLVPSKTVKKYHAREWAMMIDDPSIYKDSDDELRREGKLARKATDYLFVLINGEFQRGLTRSFNVHLNFTSSNGVTLEYQKGTIDRLGEDMWDRESFTAIPVPPEMLEKLIQGELSARLDFVGDEVKVDRLRFYRLLENGNVYQYEDITLKLAQRGFCNLLGLRAYCEFGKNAQAK